MCWKKIINYRILHFFLPDFLLFLLAPRFSFCNKKQWLITHTSAKNVDGPGAISGPRQQHKLKRT